MTQFHETLIGHRIFGTVVPSIAATLERIAVALERIADDNRRAAGKSCIAVPSDRVRGIIASLEDAANLCEAERDASSDNGAPECAESWERDAENLDLLSRLLSDTIDTNGSRKDPETETDNEPTT